MRNSTPNTLEDALSLGDHHSFAVADAVAFGVPEAIVLKTLRHWIRVNRANGVNVIDGKTWTWNTTAAWASSFPYWSESQVYRLLTKLRKSGVLLVDHHAKDGRDRTCWYTFSDGYLAWWSGNCDSASPVPFATAA